MKPAKISTLAICPPGLPAAAMLDKLRPWADLTVTADAATVASAAADAEVILYSGLAGATPPFAAVWPHTGRRLRWVHSFEAGVDRLLIPELAAGNVAVSNAKGVYAEPLAEFTVFAILYFYKQGRRLVEQQRAHRWEQFEVESPRGKVLAIVGYGGIGRCCARAARKLGMRIEPISRQDTAAPARFHARLAAADVVLAAAPLTPQTRRLLDAAAFSAMKPSALVVNAGRGPVIDETALIAALRAGRIAGAALDVFEHEPLPADHPYWSMDNVLLSPHCTDRTVEPHWTALGMRCFLQNFRRYRNGEPLLTPVDKAAGY
ncbi:MAG TPA: D-2-hydroxyacid dehydrogenase [Terriglobales bacterium]|nr:D-2-hydroxyacid dehydrogenase [Terriglobales bacterium]